MTVYHESPEDLTEKTRDLHRAWRSMIEEIEAIDWYQQRIDATGDAELRAILEHNRDEEKEHAMMLLEWIRRNDKGFEKETAAYLFKKGNIAHLEEEREAS